MSKTLTEMAAQIVAAQAGHAPMTPDEMDVALKKTFEALQCIKYVEEGKMALEEPDELTKLRFEPIKSIQKNYIINLEDGKKYKQLTARTLVKFGLTPKEYRKKYGFSARQPLAAKSLSAKRRKTAKALGLAEKLVKARKAKAKAKAAPKPAAKKPRKKKAIRGKKKA
jgi:predicted transcriptional regulator